LAKKEKSDDYYQGEGDRGGVETKKGRNHRSSMADKKGKKRAGQPDRQLQKKKGDIETSHHNIADKPGGLNNPNLLGFLMSMLTERERGKRETGILLHVTEIRRRKERRALPHHLFGSKREKKKRVRLGEPFTSGPSRRRGRKQKKKKDQHYSVLAANQMPKGWGGEKKAARQGPSKHIAVRGPNRSRATRKKKGDSEMICWPKRAPCTQRKRDGETDAVA